MNIAVYKGYHQAQPGMQSLYGWPVGATKGIRALIQPATQDSNFSDSYVEVRNSSTQFPGIRLITDG